MSARLLADTLQVLWEFDLEAHQRVFLVSSAGLHQASWRRRWHELTGSERDALLAAANRTLELAELLSRDLAGGA